jgi:hypothetical protein
MKKIERIGGSLYGFAGDMGPLTAVRKWFLNNRRGKAPKGECIVLILSAEGVSYWTATDGEVPIERDWYAIGTGSIAAMALMEAGHDAAEAVRITCLVDAQSGGELQIEKLKA